MKTVNCIYHSIEVLIRFLREEKIHDNETLLIQVFAGFTEEKRIKQLQSELASVFHKATLIGVTSDGNIMGGEIPELGNTIISLSQFEQTTLTTSFISNTESDFKTGERLGQNIRQPDTQAIIAFSDGLKTSGESFLHGLSSTVPNIPIAGGMAGDGGKFKKTFIFNLTEITSYGGIAVALNGSVLNVHTHYNFGWQPIGRKMEITHADGNCVYQIDNMPTQKIYEKYFTSNTSYNKPKLGVDFSLLEFPLIKFEHGTYIARAATSRLKDGGLVFAGNLNKKDFVQFGIGDKEQIIQDARHSLTQLTTIPVESIFIYSCTARRRLLGPESTQEIESFKGLSNVSGFYTYGEFFYTQEHKRANLLNHSMTVIALSESSSSRISLSDLNKPSLNSRPQASLAIKDEQQHNYINTLVSISNFAVNISKDFELLNSKLEDEVKKKSQALLRKTLINDLTSLPGRLALLHQLHRGNHKILIVININSFSKINGFYGLEAGDELLSKIAVNLKKYLQLNKHGLIQPRLYKLPSDEYAILTKTTDLNTLDTGMKTLNKQVFSHPYKILGFDILVQATWVFSQCDGTDKTLIQAELIGKEARVKQKNFISYQAEAFKDAQYRIQLAHQVRDALLKDQLYPVFQPIYSNTTGELIKYECLARLKGDSGEVIPPLVFIKVAQMIQMYPIITETMIHKSFSVFQGTGLSFSVNLSLEDILSETTQNMIFEAIEYFNVAHQVTFEILENQALKDEEAIFSFIHKLKLLGAKIAIDDFGSGYANYQHLAKLQADYIKIDGSLIKNLGHDLVALSVVESMIVFAKKLNMKIIAEFVCNYEVHEQVKKEGIDYSQGFYLSEPLNELPK